MRITSFRVRCNPLLGFRSIFFFRFNSHLCFYDEKRKMFKKKEVEEMHLRRNRLRTQKGLMSKCDVNHLTMMLHLDFGVSRTM